MINSWPPIIQSNAGQPIAAQVARHILNSEKAWEKANTIIERENNLLNHRMTTIITLQGLLFAGVYILMLDKNHLIFNLASCIILGIVGVATLIPSYFGMRANVKQIKICSTWFYSSIENPEDVRIPFPPLIGECSYSAKSFGKYAESYSETIAKKLLKKIKNKNTEMSNKKRHKKSMLRVLSSFSLFY